MDITSIGVFLDEMGYAVKSINRMTTTGSDPAEVRAPPE
jgi:hypothetical protein